MNVDLMLRYGRIPYLDDGDDYRGVDCRGFLRMYYADELGMILPKSTIGWRRRFDILDRQTEIKKHDAIIMACHNTLGIADHLGVAISSRDVMHAGKVFGGIVCQPIERLEGTILNIARPKLL